MNKHSTGTIAWTRLDTTLGPMVLAGGPTGLHGAWFEGQKHFSGILPHWRRQDDHPLLREAVAQLDAWFARRRQDFDLPLDPPGTFFQQRVWRAIGAIGFGQTQVYGALAQAIGQPTASRAVGAATGRNPLSIIVPCHRLLGRDGALTGYAGGLERKRALLSFEDAVTGTAPAPRAHALR